MKPETINKIAELTTNELCTFFQKRVDGEIVLDEKNSRIVIKDIIFKAIKDIVGEEN